MSNRVTITLHIDLPDGVVPDVDYGVSDLVEPEYVRPETFPAFGEGHVQPKPQYDRDAVAAPVQALPAPAQGPVCPVHNEPMKRYPAGVSKKTGKPYNASWRCSANGCTTPAIWDRDAVPV